MQSAYRTDPGRRRKENEDSVMMDLRKNIFIVADGMGGYRAGEMASRMAVEVAYDHLSRSIPADADMDRVGKEMSAAILKVHETIRFSTQNNPALLGMGTTLVMLMVRKNRACICHSGDSRGYIVRETLRQVTRDHTWGNHLMETEGQSPDEIPEKAWHALTQAVGVSEVIAPEITQLTLAPEDVILLCTDGLTDMLSDSEIADILLPRRRDLLEKVVAQLVDAANDRGGRDNISVLLARYEDDQRFFLRTPILGLMI